MKTTGRDREEKLQGNGAQRHVVGPQVCAFLYIYLTNFLFILGTMTWCVTISYFLFDYIIVLIMWILLQDSFVLSCNSLT